MILGVGRSSKGPGLLVTALSHATAIHDVVRAARNGDLGRKWDKVVLTGHSFGTLAALIEASVFQDVDGIIASGASHAPGPLAIADVVGSVRIAEQDPLTANDVTPGDVTYLSTVDLRAAEFHDPADSDPAVVAADEADRKAGTAGMFLTIPAYIPATLNIRVPVLLANGSRDRVFCAQGAAWSLTDCSSADSLYRSEKPFYPNADVEAYILPGAGHSIDLALNNKDFFARATEWIDARFH
ncbi:alpha/beta hydrolase [Nocardia sp. NBC_00565]|uniref:alpha/beta fold hydrolase n=1 Tax=Nocardia sp. NBC_00565 TaxID=2975993 RepID=UPI002E816142|nr:alpha/beta fold hydrolase [Nocardia sp. NBC_00565]WUC06815.1 alpha/beta hydrolase [Nocardia sp. NBC_00565]